MIDVTKNKLIYGDCLEVMKHIPDNSIDLVVTSPPYDNLRKYEGYKFDFEGIANQLFRVIKIGGVVVWVVGDATIKGSETGTSFRQALYFRDIGFRLHDTMIYKKSYYVPLTHNRYEQCWEYMFIFSKKDKPKTFNPILVPCKLAGQPHRNGKYDSHRREFDDSRSTKEKTSRKYKDNKIHKNIFVYCPSQKKGHPAVFPEKLAGDHILSWSNEKDIVLDPFLGFGTTAIACLNFNRRFIGIEIAKEYYDIAKERINEWYQND